MAENLQITHPLEAIFTGIDEEQAMLHRMRIGQAKEAAKLFGAKAKFAAVLLWLLDEGAHCRWVEKDCEAIGGDVRVGLKPRRVQQAVEYWREAGFLVEGEPRWENGKRAPSLVRLDWGTILAAATGRPRATTPAVPTAMGGAVAVEPGRHFLAGPAQFLAAVDRPPDSSLSGDGQSTGAPEIEQRQADPEPGGDRAADQNHSARGIIDGARDFTPQAGESRNMRHEHSAYCAMSPESGAIAHRTPLLHGAGALASRAALLENARTGLLVNTSVSTTTTNRFSLLQERGAQDHRAGLGLVDHEGRMREAAAIDIERLARRVQCAVFGGHHPLDDESVFKLRGLAACALLLFDAAWLLRAARDTGQAIADGRQGRGKIVTRPLPFLVGTARNQLPRYCAVERESDRQSDIDWMGDLLAPFEHRAGELFARYPLPEPSGARPPAPEAARNPSGKREESRESRVESPEQGRGGAESGESRVEGREQETEPDTVDVAAVRAALAERLGAERYGLWFGRGTDLQWEPLPAPGQLTVRTPNLFFRDWTRAQLRQEIERAAVEALGLAIPPNLRFEIQPAAAGSTAPAETAAAAAVARPP